MSKIYRGVETANTVVPEFEQDEKSVYIRSNIHTVEFTDEEGNLASKTVYDETVYGLGEYAEAMHNQNKALDSQLTDCELALAELYERSV